MTFDTALKFLIVAWEVVLLLFAVFMVILLGIIVKVLKEVKATIAHKIKSVIIK